MNFTIFDKQGKLQGFYEFKRDSPLLAFTTVIHYEDDNSKFGIEFMNKTIDFCKMLRDRRYEPLVGSVYAAMETKVPSLPKKCPLKKVNVIHRCTQSVLATVHNDFECPSGSLMPKISLPTLSVCHREYQIRSARNIFGLPNSRNELTADSSTLLQLPTVSFFYFVICKAN